MTDKILIINVPRILTQEFKKQLPATCAIMIKF